MGLNIFRFEEKLGTIMLILNGGITWNTCFVELVIMAQFSLLIDDDFLYLLLQTDARQHSNET